MLDSLLKPWTLPARFTMHRVNGIRQVEPGQTLVLADLEGPGCVRHLFVTMPPRNLRRLVLRMTWDDEAAPSVECPVPDFFGVGHDETTAELRSLLFYVAPRYGYNCYAPMPFSRRALVTVTNEASEACPAFYIQLEFARYGRPLETPWRFHSAWRRVMPAYRRGAPLALIEARGEGRVIGVIYHICKRDSDDRWSHGGGDHVFVDGDTPDPAYLYGMGGEDFAHHAWGLAPAQGPYSGAHMVHPVPTVKRAEGPLPFEPHGWEQHDGGRYSMYRFFIPDPIQFRRSIRFCFGTCANEISATSYWYQGEPHSPFCVLPPPDRRAYGTRVSDEECWRPLDMGRDIPVAVIGPFHAAGGRVPDLTRPVDLGATHMTDVRPPFADVVPPASEVRWRRSAIRGGFLDLAAIHRPKAAVRSRGVWNRRHVPLGVASVQLVRVQTALARRVRLRVGFEDGLAVWLNRRRVADLRRPEPAVWDLADVELALDAGWNEIALVCTQERMARWSAWGIYAKLLDGDGRPADDLAFDDFAGLDPTPERWREPAPVEAETEAEDYRDPLFLV